MKSLDGVSLQKAMVGKGGCLEHDREYAMVDSKGDFINGKSNERAHLLRSEIDFNNELISFRHEKETRWHRFHLQNEKTAIDNYLSEFFALTTTLVKNSEGRFMDIPDVAGITILSSASLQTVAGWFNDMDLEETRKRFRATIEVEGTPAFWEDRLFIEKGMAVEFEIGDVRLSGISPRARCVVPTRHPETGEVIHGFPKTFAKHRAAALPPWSSLADYGHSYFLTVNCYIHPSQTGKSIRVGNELKITGKKIIPTFTR